LSIFRSKLWDKQIKYYEVNFMKKKIVIFMLLAMCILSLSACGKSSINLSDYLIEERVSLYTAHDDLYNVDLSFGNREVDYNFDGVIGEMTPFAVLTISRIDNEPLANDTYSYFVKVNDQSYNGFLEKSNNENSYTTDLEISTTPDAVINVQISFTGYTFVSDMTNTSSEFQIDSQSALSIANSELQEEVKNLSADQNNKFEVVMKLMKDYSSADLKNYYWYISVISTDGDILGILIDANTGDIIAKKV